MTQLKDTTISARLRESIHPGKNLLWCGTFQMAWNECMKLTGGPLRFVPDSPLATELNSQEFKREFADEEPDIFSGISEQERQDRALIKRIDGDVILRRAVDILLGLKALDFKVR